MPKLRVRSEDEIFAAYLYAVERKNQAEISSELGVSPAVISRIVERVRGRYFSESIEFLRSNLTPSQSDELEDRLAAKAIGKSLDRISQFSIGRPGPRVRVFRIRSKAEGEEAIEQFASSAAPAVLELLSRTRTCGVTWGRMIAALVRAAKAMSIRHSSRSEFVPLAGEPLGFAPTSSSSSLIADELQRLFREGESHARSLTMLPALIPREFSKDERRVIERLIGHLRDYREIFLSGPGASAPIVASLDGLITSVGREPLGFAGGSLLHETDERPFFVGDIGGVLLPKSASNHDQEVLMQAVLSDIADRWKGLRLEQLRDCAAHAAASSASPLQIGVVVLSIGAPRAPVIFECVKRGLISHLFIDDSLEKALRDQCDTSRL